ncbi:hypothetical protein [Kallotenue papyrolyticum]|uniref:hypothetical protein n=1 Tax=Kallotenue papyrolyticum TaxID=1325125 RepID=UPI0004785569|nr:hypothetical protein [Kallotenue papyrolyticum]
MGQQPQADWTAYLAIVMVSLTLCLAWLLTGSIWLTAGITVLGLLSIAGELPHLREIIAADPWLDGTRRAAPLIVLGVLLLMIVINLVRS